MTWNPDLGELRFITGDLEGTFIADGLHHGVTHLVHRPTGVVLARPGPLLNVYRLLCRDGWLGEARATRHVVQRVPDGLRLVWAARPAHLAHLEATLRLQADNALDMEIEVTGHAAYEDYEVFLSNYFDHSLQSGGYVVPVPEDPEAKEGRPIQLEPKAHPVYRGLYVTLPRDSHAAQMFWDGRWHRGRNWAEFMPARPYALPLGYYRDSASGVDALVMGLRADLAAVSIAYHPGDAGPDNVSNHHSLYLSLWGQNLRPGVHWRTAVRLVAGRWNGDPDAHRAQWDAFATSSTVRTGSFPVDNASPVFER